MAPGPRITEREAEELAGPLDQEPAALEPETHKEGHGVAPLQDPGQQIDAKITEVFPRSGGGGWRKGWRTGGGPPPEPNPHPP